MNDTREQIEKMLQGDKLYEFILSKDLQDTLFSNSLLNISLNPTIPYLATDFEKLYCNDEDSPEFLCKQGTMRQFIKELDDYLEVSHIGKNITLTPLGFIRLKMALLLRKDNVKPNVIYSLAKTKTIDSQILSNRDLSSNENSMLNPAQDIQNQLLQYLFMELKNSGKLDLVEGQLKINGPLFDNQGAQSLLEVGDSEDNELIESLRAFYIKLSEEKDVDRLQELLSEIESICNDYEGSSIIVNEYKIKCEEIYTKKLLEKYKYDLHKCISELDDVDTSEGVQAVLTYIEAAEQKYIKIKTAIEIEKLEWANKLTQINKTREIKDIESKILTFLEDIDALSKKDAEKKLADIDDLISSNPRVNPNFKFRVMDKKKELERKNKNFIQRMFS